jgi:hypothetical protein
MSTVAAIWDLYATIYEHGDAAMDQLNSCAAYSKWLDAEMSDEYLANAHAFTLEMIRAELADVADYFAMFA